MQKRIWTVVVISVLTALVNVFIIQSYDINRVWFILLTSFSILLIVLTVLYHIYAYKVIEASSYIKELKNLNKETKPKFHILNDMKLRYSYDRKNQLDNITTKRFLEEDMYNRLQMYVNLNTMYLHNVNVLKTYETSFKTLQERYKVTRNTLKTYIIFIHANYLKLQLLTHQKVIVKLTYTSPQGRNHYERNEMYPFHLLNDMILKITEIKEIEETETFKRKAERSKMSSRLRFLIFQRDHYTCRICGKSKYDKVKLHVDHIIPIAKGGKTEESNLQTLCEVCNLGKSDLNMYR
jgi:hypothetical protein